MGYIGAGITRFNTADELTVTGDATFDTNTLYVDSANNKVGIGTTSPGAKLSLPAQASGDGVARIAIESAVDNNDFTIAQYEDGVGTYTQIGQNVTLNSSGNTVVLDSGHRTASILFDGRGNGSLMFQTGGTNVSSEAMRIDSSGRLLLGTTTAGESSADDLTIATTGQTGITIRSGTANAGSIYFSDGTSGTSQYSGYIFYDHNVNALAMATNAVERLRITSGGDLLVSTTDSNLTDDTTGGGIALQASGALTAARQDANPLYINRTGTTDGSMIDFRKAGATVGSIGYDDTSSATHTRTYIGYGDTGLAFIPTLNEIVGHNTSTNAANSGITLGDQNVPFENLYLSGGVYLGGTGADNLLNDYEEGTFTPTATWMTGGSVYGTYIKVGDLVHISIYFTGVTVSSVGATEVGGLPFTVRNTSGDYSGLVVGHNTAVPTCNFAYVVPNATTLDLIENGTVTYATESTGASKAVMIAGTYRAA